MSVITPQWIASYSEMPYFALSRRPLPKECMVISNENILQADYEVVESWRGRDGANDEGNRQLKKIIVPEQFRDDVSALCEYSGLTELSPGTRIQLSLQETLSILPRERRRIDSYKSLVRFLQDEMDVTLIIHSQKSKKYEE